MSLRLAAAAVFTLLAASCADGGSGEAPETAPPEPAAAPAEEEAEPPPEPAEAPEPEAAAEEERAEAPAEPEGSGALDPAIEAFYAEIVRGLRPDKTLRLKAGNRPDYPESLAEELEGGGRLPDVIELHDQSRTAVGLIAYRAADPYPITFSLVLPGDEWAAIDHYEIAENLGMPLLKVHFSHAGKGPPEDPVYYDLGNASPGAVPLATSKAGKPLPAKRRESIHAALIAGMTRTQTSFHASDCPPAERRGPASVSVDLGAGGILTASEATGYTTTFFYAPSSKSSLVVYPLDRYMLSPDGERIEDELSPSARVFALRDETLVDGGSRRRLCLGEEGDALPAGCYCAAP